MADEPELALDLLTLLKQMQLIGKVVAAHGQLWLVVGQVGVTAPDGSMVLLAVPSEAEMPAAVHVIQYHGEPDAG